MDEMKEERAEQKREAYEKLLVDEQRAAQARALLRTFTRGELYPFSRTLTFLSKIATRNTV